MTIETKMFCIWASKFNFFLKLIAIDSKSETAI
jgi:hypothetical protein